MQFKIILKIFVISILIYSCSKNETKKSTITQKSLDLQILEAYQEGMKNLKEGDVIFAAKKFNEVETMFPQSIWAPKSSLMAAYSYYVQDYYSEAIAELVRFKRVYPTHNNLDYANYLLSLCYYEQIVDETKDLESILNSKQSFESLINNYPNSEYSIDAKFKLDLIEDILAAKELYIGRYYLEKKKWISAINRFKVIINDYDNSIYVEEALHRLVEIYYIIGLKEESFKYAKLLGYNYRTSKWYEQSYKIFNKKYEIKKKERQKEKKKEIKVLNKFKSIFD
ncbi:outer membrane protein assembly factor BamD [Candidatus Pelagibacter communis]|uniref:outer membrane protein assembly factor BamD n=1 Tax=Pelagibacter ubique TaxID=198252 RepID=UPI00065B44D3|nr:outer membrane protein assembly factor BamD [Candidatus Pelagibacter ubique]